ncbi:MAG: hypothetical protein JNK05_29170 [Myxococcales bacterium]|nr:hypothetical protein [Myxococcales bacterium]
MVRRRTLAWWLAVGSGVSVAPREAGAQVFRLFAPGSLASSDQASVTPEPSGTGRHAVIAITQTLMTPAGLVATITTPPTLLSLPPWPIPVAASAELVRPSIAFLGGVPLIAWRQGGPGAHIISLDLGGATRTITAGNCSPPVVACSPSRCVVVYQTPDGSIGGRSIDAAATLSPLSIRAATTGAVDAAATTLAPAVVYDEASNAFVTAAVVLDSGVRQVQVFHTTFMTATSTSSIAVFSSSAAAEPPSLTRHSGETLLAHRTSTNIQVQRITGTTRVGVPVQVPGTASSFLPSIGSGPRGALLAFIERASGAQRPTVLRFAPSASPTFSTVRPTALVGELAGRVMLSSHRAAPLLVWEAPAAGASMPTVRALYLDSECARDDDCGLRLGGSLATACGACGSGACTYPTECVPRDAGADAASDVLQPMDVATDTGVAPDTGVTPDTGVATDTGVPQDAIDAMVDSREDGSVEDTATNPSDAVAIDGSDARSSGSGDAQRPLTPPQFRGGACACRAATRSAPGHGPGWLLGAAVLIVCARRRDARRSLQRR